MLFEYYSIRIKDAEPGKGLLHSTSHYDEVRSAIKHFKEKHPGEKIVAYKHELKKGPMGVSFKRKAMFGECTEEDLEFVANKLKEVIRLKMAGEYRREKAHIHGKDAVMGEETDLSEGGINYAYKALNAKISYQSAMKKGDTKSAAIWKKKHAEHYAKAVEQDKEHRARNPKSPRKLSKQLGQLDEATRSFKTLMRSIEDKKSIKNLKVPSPTERRAMEQPKQPEKPESVKEAVVAPVMGKTIHTVKHGEDTYTVHDMESPRSTSAFKVRRNGKLLSNHASSSNAHAWLKTHLASKQTKV